MATLTDNPEFTANEIYEIQATDPVEGAATGASFGGIGVDNEPHQQLANRTALNYQVSQANKTAIAALQAFQALFTSALGASGWIKLGAKDSNLGPVDLIVQWGVIPLLGKTPADLENALWQVTFPIPFPNACFRVMPFWETNKTTSVGSFEGGLCVLEAITPYAKAQASFFSDWDGSGKIYIAQQAADGLGLTGIGWIAIGY
jgi:hypothetical protein